LARFFASWFRANSLGFYGRFLQSRPWVAWQSPRPPTVLASCVWWAGEAQRIIRRQEQARDAEQRLDEALEYF